VRAYAGVPLVSDEGHALGSFCAIDFAPRRWTPEDVEVLTALSSAAMNEIAVREALRQSADNLRVALEAVRAREEVLALVAHDLRNPLSILTMSTLLLADMPELAEHAGVFARMGRAAQSMNTQIGELLDFSSSGSKPTLLPRVHTDPAALVADVASMLGPLAQRHGIELVVRSEPDLAEVSVDYERILRVFSNLVGNALKVSTRGGNVELSADAAGSDAIAFSVTDHGPGISEADVAHVFDPFWQKDPKDPRGVGLGLAIVKSYVEAHGGAVTVHSVPGTGSSFRFTLPVAAGDA
jgi:signal transduction histidine kinase